MRNHLNFTRLAVLLGYLLGVTAHAADQNPCVADWKWVVSADPELTITAPKDVPNSCVGQITVSSTVTAIAGQKQYVDLNNCPESPQHNPEPMPISPVNTWQLYLYPPGTTPTSGSGTSATFTTVQGGTVVVQFETRATVSNPAWDSGLIADQTNPFRVFEVASISTDLGPEICENGNTKTWVTTAGPGTITVTATPNPSVASESELPSCWTLAGGIGSSRLYRTIDKSVPGTYTVTCTAGTSQKNATVVVVSASVSITARIPVYGGPSPIQGNATVTLNPSPLPCGFVTATISRSGGSSGAATFDDGSTTRDISQSCVLSVRGTANSDLKDNMRISALSSSAQFSVRTWPVNFRQTSGSGSNGILYFAYAWDSESGSAAHLTGITMGEIVTYPGSFSIPPYSSSPPNPTIIDLAATYGTFNDTHSHPGFQTPYSNNSISGTQYYRFKDDVYAPGVYVNVMGPLSIDRHINFESPTGLWKYRITKSGVSSTITLP
jgi:hypothetical protein